MVKENTESTVRSPHSVVLRHSHLVVSWMVECVARHQHSLALADVVISSEAEMGRSE